MIHISNLHDCHLLLHDPELYREITSQPEQEKLPRH